MPLPRLLLPLCGLLLALAVTAATAEAPLYGTGEVRVTVAATPLSDSRDKQVAYCQDVGGVIVPTVTEAVFQLLTDKMIGAYAKNAFGWMGGSSMLSISYCTGETISLFCVWKWDVGRYAGSQNAVAFYEGNGAPDRLQGAGMMTMAVGNHWGYDWNRPGTCPCTWDLRYGGIRRFDTDDVYWYDSSSGPYNYGSIPRSAYYSFCASEQAVTTTTTTRTTTTRTTTTTTARPTTTTTTTTTARPTTTTTTTARPTTTTTTTTTARPTTTTTTTTTAKPTTTTTTTTTPAPTTVNPTTTTVAPSDGNKGVNMPLILGLSLAAALILIVTIAIVLCLACCGGCSCVAGRSGVSSSTYSDPGSWQGSTARGSSYTSRSSSDSDDLDSCSSGHSDELSKSSNSHSNAHSFYDDAAPWQNDDETLSTASSQYTRSSSSSNMAAAPLPGAMAMDMPPQMMPPQMMPPQMPYNAWETGDAPNPASVYTRETGDEPSRASMYTRETGDAPQPASVYTTDDLHTPNT